MQKTVLRPARDEVATAMDAARIAERTKAQEGAREVAEALLAQILASHPRPTARSGGFHRIAKTL